MKKAHALLAVAAPAVMRTDFAAYRRKLASETARYEKREAPDFTKLTETIQGIGTAFEEYKKANDQALKEAKSSGVTPETRAKLDKLDAELDKLAELKSDIEKLITRAARPNGRGDQPVIAEAAESSA
jgi:Sec-independent protein translocase protein TatA